MHPYLIMVLTGFAAFIVTVAYGSVQTYRANRDEARRAAAQAKPAPEAHREAA